MCSYTKLKGYLAAALVAVACSHGAIAQTITTPPSAMKSSQTGGTDSTIQTQSNASTSSPSTVNVPWNYKIYCTPGSTTNTTTGTCPAGQTYGGVGNGSTTFNQTYTTTTSCPQGQYANGTTSNSSPTPTASTVCATPVVTCTPSSYNNYQTANCPANYTTLSGSSTFQQTQTVTTSCPGGQYGSPSTNAGGWSPASDTNTCPKATTNTNPNICMSHGGMPYTITPNSLIVNFTNGAQLSLGAVSFGNGNTTLRNGNAAGSYTFTVAFNGGQQTFTVACTPTNNANGSGTDACDYTQNVTFNGGTWQVSTSFQTPAAMDYKIGAAAPYSGSATVTQVNCQ